MSGVSVNIIFSYIRVFVFLGCTLIGIQAPAFVDQYGKSLESHLIESQKALGEFQKDADKYFSGSLEQLIAHYKENPDQVINAGGDSIESIYDRNLMLKKNFMEFQSGSWAAYTQALLTPVPDVKKEVWKNFSYSIKLKPNAIAFGLFAGLIFTILIELLLRLLFQIPKLLNKSLQATA
jgi:hypothetical protein